MRLSNKYLLIKHHVKIKTINYCIIQCFYIIINRNFTLMFRFDLVFDGLIIEIKYFHLTRTKYRYTVDSNSYNNAYMPNVCI